MAIGDDFTIDYVNRRVTHTANTTIYTVNALYSYLQDTFDELDQLDDTIPMSAQTPNAYTLTNGWFMDDTSFQFLKEGAIQTDGYLDEIRLLTFDTADNYTNAETLDIGKQALGGGTGDTGELISYNNTDGYWWVRMDDSGDLFDAAEVVEVTSAGGTGSGTTTAASVTGEDLWSNVYTLGTILEDDSQQIYIMQSDSRAFSGSEWWPEQGSGTQHMDILFKVQEAGTLIDSGNITVFLRHWDDVLPARSNADLYDHFEIDLSAGGRNAVPLATAADLNNTTDDGTVSGYNDITIAFVNGTIDYSAMSGTFTDFETVTGSTSAATAIFIESTTVTGAGTMTLGNINGTFQNGETLTGGSSSQTALASSVVTTEYTMFKNFTQGSQYPYSVIIDCISRPLAEVYEYLKYVTRVGNTFITYPTTVVTGPTLTVTTSQGQLYIKAHEDQVTSSNSFAPVKASPFGTFAGGTFFGAQGVWVENMASADIQSFQLIDSDGTTRTPPTQVTITVLNTLASDRVAVFRTSGAATNIYKDQLTSHAANNTTGNAAFIVQEAIPSDTPQAGSIRTVEVANTSSTREKRYTYTGWSTSTFTGISPVLDRDYVGTDTAYVPFVDAEATTTSIDSSVIFNTDRALLVRVRRKTATAILPFETTGSLTDAGYTVSTIRTTDTIVT